MSENQSSLRFSLEELVWFKKGQEVEELLSISLDPHITIQEQEQYIVIQGKLHLSGEYKNNALEVDEEETSWQRKYVHALTYREDEGVYQFEHQFPVDVTIPKDRVEDVALLDVSVDSFDYDLPENACLQLNADLTISGLRGDQESVEVGDEVTYSRDHPQEDDVEANEEKEENVLDYASSNDAEKEDQPEEEMIPIQNLSRNDTVDEFKEDEPEEELFEPFKVQIRKKSKTENEFSHQKEETSILDVQSNAEASEAINGSPFSRDLEESLDRKKKKAVQEQEESSSFTEIEMLNHVESSPQSTVEQYDELHLDEPQHHEEEIEEVKEVKKKKKGKYESISLTDFFARKQEEKAAKLKMCIVQSGETLDYLAEKYEISVQQILRMNHLESNQNVFEGQVLYIPSYAGKK